MRNFYLTAIGFGFTALTMLTACPGKNETEQQTTTEASTKQTMEPIKQDWLQVKVVDMRGLDGCRFLLELENGKRLQAINLSPEHQKTGLKLRITYKMAEGYMGICMAGDMVELVNVEVIE